jgi:hypothetical protein
MWDGVKWELWWEYLEWLWCLGGGKGYKEHGYQDNDNTDRNRIYDEQGNEQKRDISGIRQLGGA